MLKSNAITTQEILTLVFDVIPLLLFLVKSPRPVTKGVIFIYVLGSFVSDAILLYNFYKSPIVNDIKWLRVFTLFEVLFFALYFFLVIKHKWIRSFIVVSFLIFLVPFFMTWNAPRTLAPFDSEPASTSAIICILFSLVYLYHSASDPKRAGKNFFNSRFWFAIGIFIYMAGNLFMFITYNSFNNKQEAWELSEIIFPLMTIVRNIFFSIGMLQKEE